MATLAADVTHEEPAREERFFSTLAIAMAVVIVAGFSTQYLMGRSTFASPLRVHVHAVLFMGWVGLFVLQSWLATRGPLALHRKVGWIAAIWMVLMVPAAIMVIVVMLRGGTSPFFFRPQEFLIGNPLSVSLFAGFTVAAIVMRKRTDWHARLHICGMTMIMGPGFGRLLPMPLLIPYAFEITGVVALTFIFAGMFRDRRKFGRVHPAWWIGVAAMAALIVVPKVLAPSAFGEWLYATTVAGYPGASVDGMAFAPPPAGALMTGR
ncbi:hypothetical protein ACWPM1_14120 [Tsuneonella sp. HG249]